MTALVIIIFNFGSAFEYGDHGNMSGAIEQADGTYDVVIGGKLYEDVSGKVIIDGELYEGAGITSKAFAKYIPYSNKVMSRYALLR